jgi:hypothetical protein
MIDAMTHLTLCSQICRNKVWFQHTDEYLRVINLRCPFLAKFKPAECLHSSSPVRDAVFEQCGWFYFHFDMLYIVCKRNPDADVLDIVQREYMKYRDDATRPWRVCVHSASTFASLPILTDRDRWCPIREVGRHVSAISKASTIKYIGGARVHDLIDQSTGASYWSRVHVLCDVHDRDLRKAWHTYHKVYLLYRITIACIFHHFITLSHVLTTVSQLLDTFPYHGIVVL